MISTRLIKVYIEIDLMIKRNRSNELIEWIDNFHTLAFFFSPDAISKHAFVNH